MAFPGLKYIWDACREAPEGPSPPALRAGSKSGRLGSPARERKAMNNGLLDEEKSFIGPLTLVGVVAVVVLLIAGLFIPSSVSTW
jgi:hypothetical protein